MPTQQRGVISLVIRGIGKTCAERRVYEMRIYYIKSCILSQLRKRFGVKLRMNIRRNQYQYKLAHDVQVILYTGENKL